MEYLDRRQPSMVHGHKKQSTPRVMSSPFETEARIIAQLRSIREAKKATQEKVGRMMNLGKSALGEWERGINIPRIAGLEAYAEAIGHHLHVIVREGPADELVELEQAGAELKAEPARLTLLIRIARAARFLPLSTLDAMARSSEDYAELAARREEPTGR